MIIIENITLKYYLTVNDVISGKLSLSEIEK